MTLDSSKSVNQLSPEERASLERMLMSRRLVISRRDTIPRRGEGATWPLSFAQQRLWFLDQLEPLRSVYNTCWAARLMGPLQVEALRQAFHAILARHESLRTAFAQVDEAPFQSIGQACAVDWTVIDLETVEATAREAETRHLLQRESERPFDLSRDLMLRPTLIRCGPEDHVLLVVMHHIASDGWSQGVLCEELRAFYAAFITGEPASLPELPIQYADYAVWQRGWLTGEVLDEQLGYWKQQLGGELPVLELPTDRPRPTLPSYRGGRVRFELPGELSRQVRQLSRQQGATLFMTLLAAFQVLLYRYTGQTDLVVGTPIAGRARRELEGLIGFFVNTLVLRVDLSGEPSFRQLLGRVREVALEAYSHQELPFEKLVEELQPERDVSRNPLFQVMFILQNAPRRDLELGGLEVSPVEVEIGTAKFDLTLSLSDRAQGLAGVLEYSTDLFDRETVERLAGHYRRLLEGAVDNPEERISRLPLLTEREQHQILVEWNDTRTEYPRNQCIQQLFEGQVDKRPDRVAVGCAEQWLSYGELNSRANQIAHYLRGMGVRPKTLVGICMERSVEMVVGLLGILKAGGAYVPLDPAYPQHRLAYMVEDAQIQVLLTQQRLLGEIPAGKAEVVCLDRDWARIARESRENPESTARPEDLAYVIYTSGSTGKPKGVQIPQEAVVNFLYAMRQTLEVTDKDILLAVTTLSFDIAALELFLPLTVGAGVVVASREETTDGGQLLERLTDSGATVMQATPATWRLLLETGWQSSKHLKILCGGETLPPDLANQLLEKGGTVWNLYGPTETTIWSSVFPVTTRDEPILIGRPIANTQFYVLDANLQPVPVRVAGELYIGGDGLARGYLNRPELTKEKFVSNPLASEMDSRLYRTGDLVRNLPDGNLEFLGRIDNQVKLRGFRIELGEIEAALRQHPALREAVVVAREMAPGDRRLIAYTVAREHESPSIRELRGFLKERLPDYMIPSSFVALDALPVTPNGKVDRNALPSPDKKETMPEEVYVAPRNSMEFRLVEIWERVLGVRLIGMSGNFFELGGHSLLAVRLFSEIKKVFNKELRLATLFQAPTIEQLAKVISQEKWTTPWSSLVAIQPKGSNPPFFCVHAHRGEVLGFWQLAKHLGLEQPFYGLQALVVDGNRRLHRSVEDMAAHYLEEIRSLQPEGPYFMGGLCFGAKVAFEMAHQLHAQKQKVALLAVIDAYAPGYPRLRPWLERQIVLRFKFHLRNLKKLASRERLLYLLQKAGILKTRIQQGVHGSSLAVGRFLLGVKSDDPFPRSQRYVPRAYAGKIIVFSPTQPPEACYLDQDMGWGRLAREGLEIHEIPGEFGSIIKEPSVQVLAEELKKCFSKAELDERSRACPVKEQSDALAVSSEKESI
jgi:amino acid adenylation domain-containing protein